MRQPINPEIVEVLIAYHAKLMGLFKRGKLKGKVRVKMSVRCSKMGVSVSAFYKKLQSGLKID